MKKKYMFIFSVVFILIIFLSLLFVDIPSPSILVTEDIDLEMK